MNAIGAPLDRVDGPLKVTGGARYSAEFPLTSMAHAVMVTSTIGNGRIVEIDTTDAMREPGVITILTHRNAPRVRQAKSGEGERYLPILQDDIVRYDRQPVALVVAETFEAALDAASRVAVRYHAEPPATKFSDATPYKPNAIMGEPADLERGDPDAALAAAEVKIDATFSTPVEHHNPMEPHATIAVWDGGRLTLYDATQGIFGTRKRVAEALEIPVDSIRVITEYVGGGFGCKGSAWPHVVLAALAAKVVRRPVKLVADAAADVRLRRISPAHAATRGARRNAAMVRSTVVIHEAVSQTSTFDEFVEPSTMITRMLYATPALRTTQRVVRLNAATPTFMRAPGESSGSFALESAIDELAYAVAMDPIALRLRNYAESDPSSGKPFSSKSLRECYRVGAERFGWSKRNPKPRSMSEGGMLVGYGMATATYPTHRGAAAATARLSADGSAQVLSGTQDLGTGSYTVFAQVAASVFDLPVERVRFELGDTHFPAAPVSGGSQTAASVGSAVYEAASSVTRKLLELALADEASPLHGLTESQIRTVRGGFVSSGDPAKSERFIDILKRHDLQHIEAYAESKPGKEKDAYSMHAFGAHFAEVRVDPELGTVRVERLTGAFASGRILNAKTARSQYMGGMIWGMSMALFEDTQADPRTGRIMTANLEKYLVPVNADIPAVDVILVPEDDPHVNPIGVKGIGEIGIVGSAAAVANAVYHATGVRVRDLPIVTEKLPAQG